ncbi:hypothetical protein V8C34DRAFT_7102 [Trichoderma compactum]
MGQVPLPSDGLRWGDARQDPWLAPSWLGPDCAASSLSAAAAGACTSIRRATGLLLRLDSPDPHSHAWGCSFAPARAHYRRANGDTSARWPVPSTRGIQPATTRRLWIPQPGGIGAHGRLVTRRPLTSMCRYQRWYLYEYLDSRQSRDPGRLPACALFGLLGQDNLVSEAHLDGLHI